MENDKATFIKVDNFDAVVAALGVIKKKLSEAKTTLDKISSLKQEEDEEIYRIFCGFTSEIMEVKDDIFQNNKLLAELDYDFAAAKMGNYFGSSRPVISDKQIVKLVEARHPLLIHAYKSVDKVIPFDRHSDNISALCLLPNTAL